jgi:hypothetical protein
MICHDSSKSQSFTNDSSITPSNSPCFAIFFRDKSSRHLGFPTHLGVAKVVESPISRRQNPRSKSQSLEQLGDVGGFSELMSVEQLVDFCPLKWWFISLRLVQYGFIWIYVTFLLSSKHGLVTSGGLMTIMTYCGLRISRNLRNLPSNMGIYNGFIHQKWQYHQAD